MPEIVPKVALQQTLSTLLSMKTMTSCFLLSCVLVFGPMPGAFSQSFTFTTLAGAASQGSADGTGAGARFSTAQGVAGDTNGNGYVGDSGNDTIRQITPTGVVTTLAGLAGHPGSADGTNTNARFYFPDGIAVDDATNLYVSDSVNNTIRKMTSVGTNWVVSTLAGQTNNFGSLDGTGTNALFWAPSSVAVDRQGNVYVSDTDNHTIRKITTNAVVSTWAGHAGIAGSTDATGTNALFHYPAGVAVDSAGTAYVADTDNNVIRKITTNDVVSTLAGVAEGSADGTGASARFWRPAGATVDKSGNVFVADYYTSTIREIRTNSAVSTIAGQAGIIGSADRTNG